MKAKGIDKPRLPKTWRLDQVVIKLLATYSKKNKKPESEIIEQALYDYLTR